MQKIRELEAMAPSAPAPGSAEPQIQPVERITGRREYVLKLYGYPVGVVVDKDKQGRYSYKTFQPVIKPKLVGFIEQNFGAKIGADMELLEDTNFIKNISYKASKKTGIKITDDELPKIKYYLMRDAMGGGVIDILLYDENVKEIVIAGTAVTVSYGAYGRLDTNLKFVSKEQVDNLIFRIARVTNQTIDENNPLMEVNFQGFNIEATYGVHGSSSRIVMKRF